MNITESEFQYCKERLLTKMIQILIDERHLSLEDAMEMVYTSDIFEKLSDPHTALFTQSPRYVLSYLPYWNYGDVLTNSSKQR